MGRGRGGRENGVAREPGTHLAHSTQGPGTAGNRSAPRTAAREVFWMPGFLISFHTYSFSLLGVLDNELPDNRTNRGHQPNFSAKYVNFRANRANFRDGNTSHATALYFSQNKQPQSKQTVQPQPRKHPHACCCTLEDVY